MISDREMDDFDAAILGAGFEVDDFSVVDMEHEPTAKEHNWHSDYPPDIN